MSKQTEEARGVSTAPVRQIAVLEGCHRRAVGCLHLVVGPLGLRVHSFPLITEAGGVKCCFSRGKSPPGAISRCLFGTDQLSAV